MSQTEKDNTEGLRLSQQQRRLWALARRGAEARAQCSVTLAGELDEAALAAALGVVVRRHEILRTTFRHPPGLSIPLQVIGDDDDAPPLRRLDLAALDTEAQRRGLEELWREEAARPFDLARGPVLHATLARLGAHSHALLLSLPAVCADARTLRNLVEELARFYAAPTAGVGSVEEAESADEPFQYADFAEWQNGLQEEPEAEAGRRFWAARLAARGEPVRLPFERAREDVSVEAHTDDTGPARAAAVWGPAPLPTGVGSAADACGVGAGVLLLAAWATLLRRLGGVEEFFVSAGFDGRAFEELEGALGHFERALPVRCRVDETATVGSLAAQLSAELTETAEWQDYYEPGVDSGDDAADAFPAFSFVEEFDGAEAAGLRFTLARQSVTAEPAACRLRCTQRGADFAFSLDYDPARHSTANVSRLAASFERLVASVCAAGPEAPVASLPLLGEDERRRMLGEWNATRADYERSATIDGLVSRQAARTPELFALSGDGLRITYAELEARASALAARLRREGVGAGSVVGVAAARRPETVAAMLGVLKAGAAYVPLEPSAPAGRAAFMLENAGARLLIEPAPGCAGAGLREAAARASVTLLTPDEGDARGATRAEDDSTPEHARSGDDLAYVIYTSGSTGEPKGVMVSHRSLVNYSFAVARRLGSLPGERYALVSTLAADLCHTALYPALVTGGRVVICTEEEAADGRLFAERVEAEGGVEYLKAVPSHAEALLRGRGAAVLPNKTLVVGGEASSRAWAEGLLREASATRALGLLNHYGPTEATVGALTFRVGEAASPGDSGEAAACAAEEGATVPVGRPLDNVRAYVVERVGAWQLAPLGVVGELYLGGDGLARGYIGRPALTAERFLPDPFSEEPGARVYRTGDLARRLPGGEIEFVGRVDEQLKLRGYRIEPGEIEAALRALPGVSQSAVVVREDAPAASRRLVAYLVPQTRGASLPPAAELRRMLSDRLPEYMIPSAFVTLERLPLTPNGKLDRRALPAPEATGPSSVYREPRTEAERTLAEVWREVLKVERVGVNDNFFELGGDSILSIQLAARAAERGLRLSPRLLFEHQTVAALAEAATRANGDDAPADVAPEQGEVTGPVPLTPVQRRFFEADDADPHHYNQSVRLALPPDSDPDLHARCFAHLVERHDALRLRFRREGGEWLQHNAGVAEAGAHELERYDLRHLGAAEAEAELDLAASRMQRTLDLTSGPLVRAAHALVRGGARLLVVAHHLCTDGVSWRVLLEDWQRLYESEAGRGDSPARPLAAKTASYRRWAEALAGRVSSGALDAEVGYWSGVGVGAARSLPAEDAGGSNLEGEAEELTVELGEGLTGELLGGVSRAWKARPQELVLGALCAAVCRWAGADSVVVTVEGHGREEWAWPGGDVTRTVGWFTSLYPVAVGAWAGASAGEWASAAKEALRGVPGGGVGYGMLRYLSGDGGVRRALEEAGQSALVFNYLGNTEGAAGEGGWRVLGGAGGEQASAARVRPCEVSAAARVADGRLRLTWGYSRERQSREKMREVLNWWAAGLEAMAEEWRRGEAPAPTAADFPLSGLTNEQLGKVLARVGKAGK